MQRVKSEDRGVTRDNNRIVRMWPNYKATHVTSLLTEEWLIRVCFRVSFVISFSIYTHAVDHQLPSMQKHKINVKKIDLLSITLCFDPLSFILKAKNKLHTVASCKNLLFLVCSDPKISQTCWPDITRQLEQPSLVLRIFYCLFVFYYQTFYRQKSAGKGGGKKIYGETVKVATSKTLSDSNAVRSCVLTLVWPHQPLCSCCLWEVCSPSICTFVTTSIHQSALQIDAPALLLRKWFQMGMNISSPTSLCHLHDPLHWGKDYLFLSSFSGLREQSSHVMLFFWTGGEAGEKAWAAAVAEILQARSWTVDIW